MNAIADAIVFAVTYLSISSVSDDRADNDCNALESITAYLREATPAERHALHEAVQRAIAAETASKTPRPDVLDAYSDFIDNFIDV